MTCSVCGKPMRSRRVGADQEPDTVAIGRKDPPLCASCNQRRNRQQKPRIYRCEARGCYESDNRKYGLIHSVPVKDRSTRRKGLRYCTAHYPLPECRVCGRRLRPRDAKVELWPGTAAKAEPDRCTSCFRHKISKPVSSAPKVTEDEKNAVRRLVVRHYQQFEADSWLEPAEEVLERLGLD